MKGALSSLALALAIGACSLTAPSIDYTGLTCSPTDPCGQGFSCGPKGTCISTPVGGSSGNGSTGTASGTSSGSNGAGSTGAGGSSTGANGGSSTGGSTGTSGTSGGASSGGLTQGLATVALGRAHGCQINALGAIDCWGNNDVGQLGNATLQASWLPLQVVGFTGGAAAIAAGGDQSCALNSSGAVICWGDQSGGSAVDNLSYVTTPTYVSGLNSGVTSLAVGYSHTCAVAAGGAAKCWGDNDDGQLGNGTYTNSTGPVTVMTFANGTDSVAAGDYHSCALRVGLVGCWGNNSNGQLGDGLAGNPSNVAATVVGISTAVAIAAGSNHSCAILDGGAVDCWGANDNGQLGTQSAPAAGSASPVPVDGLTSGVVAIAAGGDHNCVLTSAGAVLCWGANVYGELGNGSAGAPSSTATQVTGLGSGMVAISAGQHSSCAEKSDGEVDCWGYGGDGELGASSVGNSTTPQNLAAATPPPDAGAPPTVVSLIGGVGNSLALTPIGTVLVWGENLDGQLGTGDLETRLLPSPMVSLDAGVISISVGTDHGCAALASGGVVCWGSNDSGQLGNGSTASSLLPVPVSGLPAAATAVACGGSHSCAVAGGALYCWGENPSGELGNGSTTSSDLPEPVVGLDGGVATVQANQGVTCALTVDGGLLCWGANPSGLLGNGNGQVGNANGIPSTTPAQVTGLTSGVLSFSIGSNHGCAVTSAGAVECWGENFFGELGDGNATGQGAPFQVSGLLSGFQAVTVGDHHSCGLTSQGEVFCWGRGSYGELGTGSTSDRNYTPASVTGLGSGVTAIAAGDDHTCALTTGGMVCWGYGGNGAMGTGTLDNATTPGPVE